MSSVVYWIHSESQTDIFSEGYIGYTSKRFKERVKSHKYNFKRFCKDGNSGGCKKLYAFVKEASWDMMVLEVICVGSSEYCLDLEQKLRPEPNIGLNTRVGGDKQVMYKRDITQATREKLRLAGIGRLQTEAAKLNISILNSGKGNGMYGTAPWEHTTVKSNPPAINCWLNSDKLYDYWIDNNKKVGVKNTSKIFPELNYNSIGTVLRKFKKGWVPELDSNWLKFKENIK